MMYAKSLSMLQILLALSMMAIQITGQLQIPSLPSAIQPPGQVSAVAALRGKGTQNYGCSPQNTWTLSGPQALLYSLASGQLVGTHAGIQADRLGGTVEWVTYNTGNATTGNLTSYVQARAVSRVDQTPNGNVAWVLLLATANGVYGGPLFGVSHVVRYNTLGGLPPAGNCTAGDQFRSYYETDYYFFSPATAPSPCGGSSSVININFANILNGWTP
eukprot:TRINITY_DN4833_c0_g1_i1.p1 TRINITY_DN4833_c0_g1~~TRINITY_DN4833_c0_g1_i1.p1  ORF type:complete len:217 (+),score=42.58 TRINITY_DN4833_c0_g1_i1:55-705(+)